MRLLLTTQDFPPNTGGIETYCFELAKRFSKSTENFAVLAPYHREAKTLDPTLGYGVYRVPIKNSLLPLMAPFPQVSFSLKKKFDTVLHAQWQTVGASILSQKMTGHPKHIYVAAHARELLLPPFNGQGGMLSKKMHSWRKSMLRKVDGFFPVSHYTASLLEQEGVPNGKINVIGNGTDPQRFKPVVTGSFAEEQNLNDKKVILTICRLVPRKGIDLVLKALKEIKDQNEELVYLIGGTGPDEERLKQMVSEFGLEENVRFLGRVADDEMAAYYSLSDVFVMPARNEPPDVEGFGIVFLEANACETAVIGSKTGGIPDAVIHGETGYLIEEQNVNELVNYLLKILNDDSLSRKMGKAGRKRVLNEANWDYVAQSILDKMQLINSQADR